MATKPRRNIPDSELQNVIRSLGGRSFSTYDFIIALQQRYPATWQILEKEYGVGGAGAGKAYSAYSRVAHTLDKAANSGEIAKLDYRNSPKGWGSPVIRYWASGQSEQEFPDDVCNPETVTEGAKLTVIVNKFERNSTARLKCIDKWGVACAVCGFDFEKKYGYRGAGYIHVHHLKPLSEIGEAYQLDPVKDLRPVCPNCHAMLHRTVPAISIDALKELLHEETQP
jgi:hypothetical protein